MLLTFLNPNKISSVIPQDIINNNDVCSHILLCLKPPRKSCHLSLIMFRLIMERYQNPYCFHGFFVLILAQYFGRIINE
jgi:hypothetical protein